MMNPLVLDLAEDNIPVAVTCPVLGFSKQAFYKWRAQPVCARDYDDAHLINAAVDVHHDGPGFGYRFIADELAGQGWSASRNRVNRLCTLQQLWSVHARRRGWYRKPGPPVHDDLVGREFTDAAPNRLWFTDITEHPTRECKLYLCAVKDACSKRIVGYSIDTRMTFQLAVHALRNAILLRTPDATAIVHSDRGSQFRSHAYQRVLHEAQLPRVDGASRDLRGQRRHGVVLQPAAEERLNRRRWATRAELWLATVSWIETTYQRRRRHDTLGRLAPSSSNTLTASRSPGLTTYPTTVNQTLGRPGSDRLGRTSGSSPSFVGVDFHA